MIKNMVVAAALLVVSAFAQTAPSAPARELYRIHFFKAAPGRLPDLIDAYLHLPVPASARPLVFRHQSGDDWDLLVIYPHGEHETLNADPHFTDEQRKIRERIMGDYIWHSDTYATGPAVAEVQKALNQPKGTTGGFYLVEDYTALNGHGKQLDDILIRDIASARAPGAVRFDHYQGAGWDFLVVFRYTSLQEYAAAEADPAADDLARKQGFKDSADVSFVLREHMAAHHDTLATRIE